MLEPIYQVRFRKDVDKASKRGKDIALFKAIVHLLLQEKPIPVKNYNHKLKGEFKDHWECHIAPDWLMIYKKTKTEVIFIRMGSHSDLL